MTEPTEAIPLDPPLPPAEYRSIVGLPDPAAFDNPAAVPAWTEESLQSGTTLDFGCGAGRLARHLIRRDPRPKHYLGIDRHKGMIDWCLDNLAPLAQEFEFRHHDVLHPVLNPAGTPGHLELPVDDDEVSLFIAISVFTHLLEEDASFYLKELGRILGPQGLAVTTWFLFDKGDFPMMQEFQNALMINPHDLTNAVIFDREWLLKETAAADLVITHVTPPTVRGYHWGIHFQRQGPGRSLAAFPEDLAPRGVARPPLR